MKLLHCLFFILISIHALSQADEYCIHFRGDSGLVRIPHSASLEMSNFGMMTIEFWIRPENQHGQEALLIQKSPQSWNLSLDSNMRIRFTINSDHPTSIYSAEILDSLRWYHIAGTYEGDSMALYINSILQSKVPCGSMYNAANQDIIIGQGFTGYFDELRLWRQARSIPQLQFHMHHEIPEAENIYLLSCALSFNEDSSSFSTDVSAFGNHAFIQAMDTLTARNVSTAPLPFRTVLDGDFSHDSIWQPEQGKPVESWSRIAIDNHVFLDTLTSFLGLEIDTASKLTIKPSGAITLADTLINRAGYQGLVIKSDSSGEGSLIHHTPNISGRMDRYFSENTWHHFASPMQSIQSGVFLGMWLIPYDEPGGGWGNYISSTHYTLEPMHGHGVWSSSAYTGNHTIHMNGEFNEGEQNGPTFTRSQLDPYYDGFNFTGNPYPSGIDWEAEEGIHRTKLENAIYMYDADRRTYRTYVNKTGVNGGNRYIPPTQGFFVRVKNSETQGSLQLDNACRRHYNYVDQAADTAPHPVLRLYVESDSSGYGDEIAICFDGPWEPGFTTEKDAFKLVSTNNEIPQLWSLSADSTHTPLSINNVGLFLDPLSIRLALRPGHDTTFRIRISEEHLINANTLFMLEDLKDSSMIDFRDTVYQFPAGSTDSLERFLLHIDPTGFMGRMFYGDDSTNLIEGGKLQVRGDDTNFVNLLPDGSFAVPFADTGEYILEGSSQALSPEGTVNAVDAMLALRFAHGLHNADSLFLNAADVNQDNAIDSLDAYLIGQEFVNRAGGFNPSAWIFEKKKIHLLYSDIKGIKVRGLQRGDLNASRR